MRKFIQRALNKLAKLDKGQIRALLYDMATENDRLETVLHSMTDGVLVADTEHNLILYNKAAESFLHLSSGELYEKKIWTIIKDQEIAEFIKRALKNQERIFDKEFTIDLGGSSRVLSFSIMPLVKERKIQGNLVHIEEVTEKRSKEARLRRAENLASLTTLAAGVAHEIKNPLGSMSIHLQLIEKQLKSASCVIDGEIKHHLDVINEEVNRLNGIVLDFLFAVRPMDANLEEQNINHVVRETVNFISFELEEDNIHINLDLDETICPIQLDEKLIRQALLNLIKNAQAAMPEGGTLTIRTRKKHEYILLDVQDTGTGVPEDIITKIFEPYFTTKEFGSGLGLTVVYKIIKEHLGDISVRSKQGEGTAFSMVFPIPQKEKRLLQWGGDDHEVQFISS